MRETGLAPGTGQMFARTDALSSQSETGKMTASIVSVVAGCYPAQASDNSLAIFEFTGRLKRSHFSSQN